MHTEQPPVSTTLEGVMAQKAARYWWAVLLSGIAWLIVAWVVLRMDIRSLAAVGVLIGVFFLMSALNEAALAQTVTGGWKVLHYAIAAAFVLAAVWAFVRPIDTFFALASVLGLILVLEGAFQIVRAIAGRDQNPFWWMSLFSGVLLLLLAFWVSSSDREFLLGKRAVLILVWVGFLALFRGISQIGLAFGVRRLARDLDATSQVDRPAEATSPTIPEQHGRATDAARSSGQPV